MTIKPSLRGRGEDGAASADDHLHLPVGDAPPVLAALGGVQMAVQHRDVAAAAAKRLDGLRRQADFGNEDQRFLALAHDFLDGAEVEFGLAAAGDAVQEKWLKSACLDSAGSSLAHAAA